MQQIRIASAHPLPQEEGRFACDWMEGCAMNQWLLKTRLAQALAVHGPQSHWMETRPLRRAEQRTAA